MRRTVVVRSDKKWKGSHKHESEAMVGDEGYWK